MTSVYVREQGAMVRKRGERLVISKQGQTIEEFPMNQVQQVVLLGNVQITTQTMVALVQRQGFVTIEALAQQFGVTPQTIRRDINELAAEGVLQRTQAAEPR